MAVKSSDPRPDKAKWIRCLVRTSSGRCTVCATPSLRIKTNMSSCQYRTLKCAVWSSIGCSKWQTPSNYNNEPSTTASTCWTASYPYNSNSNKKTWNNHSWCCKDWLVSLFQLRIMKWTPLCQAARSFCSSSQGISQPRGKRSMTMAFTNMHLEKLMAKDSRVPLTLKKTSCVNKNKLFWTWLVSSLITTPFSWTLWKSSWPKAFFTLQTLQS